MARKNFVVIDHGLLEIWIVVRVRLCTPPASTSAGISTLATPYRR